MFIGVKGEELLAGARHIDPWLTAGANVSGE